MSVNCVSAIKEHLSIPVFKLIGMAVQIVGQRADYCAAFLARLYVFNDRFAKRHPHIVVTRRAFGRHRFSQSFKNDATVAGAWPA